MSGKKDSTGAKVRKVDVAEARRAHKAILVERDRVNGSWTALAEKICKFREAEYHRGVNDENGQPFRRFTDWAKSVFGGSRSKILSYASIIKALKHAVPQEDLEEMPQVNAEQLARASKAGVELKPEMVTAGKKLPAREFKRKVINPALPEAKRSPEVERITFQVDAETAELVNRGMGVARDLTKDDDDELSANARALRLIFGEFLAGHDEKEARAAVA